MGSDDLFEAVSNPMRIEIVKLLAEKPICFADLKRAFKISSSGLLDFHLKKLNDLITTNDEGNYTLTEKGFAALQAVETTSKYFWLRAAQRRSFFLALIVSILVNVYMLWILSHLNDYTLWFAVVLPLTVAWMLFYSYLTFVKRRIRLRK
jgi:DNA-binding transcriptional ArsR family regulator